MANKIHPTVIMDGDIQIGDNNEIGPYTVLYGPLKIGNGNIISPQVTIGTPGEDSKNPRYDCSSSIIEIGDYNIIREHTSIQKPCYRDVTRIGNRVYLMHGVHIPHDAIIDDDAVLTPTVTIGGFVHVLSAANLGIGSTVHQYSVIGQYSMIAMGATVTKNVKPFAKFIPGKKIRINDYAVKKFGFSSVRDQIVSYLEDGTIPDDCRLREIINYFEEQHKLSGRDLY